MNFWEVKQIKHHFNTAKTTTVFRPSQAADNYVLSAYNIIAVTFNRYFIKNNGILL